MTPVLLLSLVLASAQPEEFVLVDKVPLAPQANLIYADGTLSLHPYVGLGAGAGDDPRGGDGGSTVWGIGLMGATVRWFITPTDRIETDAALLYRRYHDTEPDHDWTGYLRVNGRHQAENGWVEGDGGISREDGVVAVLGTSSRVDSVYGRVGVANLFAKGGTVLRAGASGEEYDGAGEDRDNWKGNAELYGFLNRSRGRYGLRIRGNTTQYRETTTYTSSTGVALLIGIVHHISEKTKFAADVGATMRVYDTGNSGNDVYAPLASMVANWEFADQSTVGITFTVDLDDNSAGNAETLAKIGPITRIRLAQDWQLAAQATFGHGYDTGRPTGEKVEDRRILEGTAAIEYHFPRNGMAVRLEVYADDYTATYAGDSHSFRTQLMFLTVW